MKSKLLVVIIGAVLVISVLGYISFFPGKIILTNGGEATPITYWESNSIIGMDMDYLIKHAELIAIGTITSSFPSQWSTRDGKLPPNIERPIISARLTIISDQNFLVYQTIAGYINLTSIRIRMFGGTVGKYRVIDEASTPLIVGGKYLLFLHKNRSSTRDIFPGNLQLLGYNQGAYLIKDGKAKQVLGKDEWSLNDLLAYIQKSLSTTPTNSPTPTSTPTETSTYTPTPTIKSSVSPINTSSPTRCPCGKVYGYYRTNN